MQNEEDGREGRHDDEDPVGDILADNPPFDSAAGLHLMSSGDLEVAIGHVSTAADEWEGGGATSREEAVRVIDRCVVIEVAELSGDARRRALKELVADLARHHGMVPADLDEDSLEVLDGVGLRRTGAVVTAALAEALEAGRAWPNAGDLRAALTLLGGGEPRSRRRAVGFVHF